MFDDLIPRYAPETVACGGKNLVSVLKSIFHPKGLAPNRCPIITGIGVLELQTENGSRWYGCQEAYINSELKMVVIGCNSRDEIRMGWQICKEEKKSYV